VKGTGAVKKNARNFDERRFQKSFDAFEEEHGEVLDASDALADLTKHVRAMAKSNTAGIAELQSTVMVLAKGLHQSLKAQASLAADLELIKKQPATSPANGFVVLNKTGANGKARSLSKSDIQDVVVDAMNDGLVDNLAPARLQKCRTQAELQDFVESLPADVQATL